MATTERDVFKGKYFRLALKEVAPGVTFEMVYKRDGITVIPITDDGLVRLIKKVTADNARVRIRPVSGYIEDDESPLACAQKELAEELGLETDSWELFTQTYAEAVETSQYFFIAKGLRPLESPVEGDKNEKILEHVDLPPAELRDRTLKAEFGSASNAFALLKFVAERCGI